MSGLDGGQDAGIETEMVRTCMDASVQRCEKLTLDGISRVRGRPK